MPKMFSLRKFLQAFSDTTPPDGFIGERNPERDFVDKNGNSTMPEHRKHFCEFENVLNDETYLTAARKFLDDAMKTKAPKSPYRFLRGLRDAHFICNVETNEILVLHPSEEYRISTYYILSEQEHMCLTGTEKFYFKAANAATEHVDCKPMTLEEYTEHINSTNREAIAIATKAKERKMGAIFENHAKGLRDDYKPEELLKDYKEYLEDHKGWNEGKGAAGWNTEYNLLMDEMIARKKAGEKGKAHTKALEQRLSRLNSQKKNF